MVGAFVLGDQLPSRGIWLRANALCNSRLDRLHLGSSPWRGRRSSLGLGSSNGHKERRWGAERGRGDSSGKCASGSCQRCLSHRSGYEPYGAWTKENETGWDTHSKCANKECTTRQQDVTMENVVSWDIRTQFVLHRRHITSPLQSLA
jgi:hypothetical protein